MAIRSTNTGLNITDDKNTFVDFLLEENANKDGINIWGIYEDGERKLLHSGVSVFRNPYYKKSSGIFEALAVLAVLVILTTMVIYDRR